MAATSSLSNAKLISAFVVDRISFVVSRRGYAAAAASQRQGGIVSSSSVMMKKKGREESTEKTSWVPDPKTGYYRPENQGKEIDAVELREMLLKHKINRH
ncbi:hypothetical protein LguiA_020256 [Lonicera macranthoides]